LENFNFFLFWVNFKFYYLIIWNIFFNSSISISLLISSSKHVIRWKNLVRVDRQVHLTSLGHWAHFGSRARPTHLDCRSVRPVYVVGFVRSIWIVRPNRTREETCPLIMNYLITRRWPRLVIIEARSLSNHSMIDKWMKNSTTHLTCSHLSNCLPIGFQSLLIQNSKIFLEPQMLIHIDKLSIDCCV